MRIVPRFKGGRPVIRPPAVLDCLSRAALATIGAMPELTSYSVRIDEAQAERLRRDLETRGFVFRPVPHARFGAMRGKLQVTLYNSGKLLMQGRDTREFVEFYLEPVLLKEARLGYETVLDPSKLEERIGIDESGKGDYFGPLVVGGVHVGPDTAPRLIEAGVRDSKNVKSDKQIELLYRRIRDTVGDRGVVHVVIGPEAYNRLYEKMRNVNRILGWGHARPIENLLERDPCPRVIADQFGNKATIERALMQRGRDVDLIQRHRAESDIAVAAASIVARAQFIRYLKRLSEEFGVDLPKGASARVVEAARALVGKCGRDALAKAVKLHFKTTREVLGLPAKEGGEES